MTQYTIDAPDGLTLKIDYLDPVGGFGGWFLLTFPSALLAGPITEGTGDGSATQWGAVLGASPGANQYQIAFAAAVKQRLVQMFGTDSTVNWKATFLQSITPAVLDADY